MFERFRFRSIAAAAVGGAFLLGNVSARAQGSRVWSVVPSPNAVTDGNQLNAVSADTRLDAWAVGIFYNGNVKTDTLAERWNGKAWSVVGTPNGTGNDNELIGVTAIAPNNAWAVGQYDIANITRTLIEHWDGRKWTIVPSPTPGKFGGSLFGVAAVTATDMWAGGRTYTSNKGNSVTLIEHWNGKSWSVVPTPNQSSVENYLGKVTVVNARDIWSCGAFSPTTLGYHQTLAEHWNGSSWSIVPTPDVNTNSNNFNEIAALSATSVFATGDYYDTNTSVFRTLAAHWNGKNWSLQSSANQGNYQTVLGGIAGVSPSEVVSVGNYQQGQVTRTFAMLWNGGGWSVTITPNVSVNSNFLNGASTIPTTADVWAVGGYDNSNGSLHRTLIERYH